MLEKTNLFGMILAVAGLWAGIVRAETFKLEGDETLTGDVVSCDERGVIVRTLDGKYSDRVAWTRFSQADLKRLGQNPKVAPLVEPFWKYPWRRSRRNRRWKS